jgi:Glycosyl transferase family 11
MTRPVVARIAGGLGNQLFQYAAARSLADRLGVPLRLDNRWFAKQDLRKPAISAFDIRHDGEGTRPEFALGDWWGRLSGQVVKQHRNDVVASLVTRSQGAYLDGYWQSAFYFEGNAEHIRRDLQVKAPASGRNAELLTLFSQRPGVSVHVRRSDYLLARHQRVFAPCGFDYYQAAAAYVATHVGADPLFAVFSDDPDWCRGNLKLPGEMVFVDHNGPDAGHEDLRLMAACQHHIIANSTFSWWGAWLDARPNKIVCSPQTWFVTPKLQTAPLLLPHFILFPNV